MKRRVIQIANSTQLISLPMQWAKEKNIKKGDELEVEVFSDQLVIRPESSGAIKTIDIDVTPLDRSSIIHIIRALYRRGFDEINITFNNPVVEYHAQSRSEKVASIIYTEVSRLSGLEIIRQSERFCGLKCISEARPQEFTGVLRRVFTLLDDLCTDFVNGVNDQNLLLLETVEEKHHNISKFISYCMRILNKHSLPKIGHATFLHHILAGLDLLIDNIKYTARDLVVFNKPLSDITKKLLTKTIDSFRLYSSFFIKYEYDIANRMNENRQIVKKEMMDHLSSLSGYEVMVLTRMVQSMDCFLDLTEARMSILDLEN